VLEANIALPHDDVDGDGDDDDDEGEVKTKRSRSTCRKTILGSAGEDVVVVPIDHIYLFLVLLSF
jgi:hypothetical protein